MERRMALRRTLLSALSAAVLVTLSLLASERSQSSAGAAAGSLLPRAVVVPMSVVSHFFPEVTREASTGKNSAAVGSARATRLVIYANADGSRKVTLSVDQYATPSDASSAFQEAVEKSKSVPGHKPVSVPTVGQQCMAGVVTQGAETHVGIGVLDADLIIGATIAGYDATPQNINKLVALTRQQAAAGKKAMRKH